MQETISSTHRLPAGTKDVITTEFSADVTFSHRTHVDKIVTLNEIFQSITSIATFHDGCFLADGTWDYEALDALTEYLIKQRKDLNAV